MFPFALSTIGVCLWAIALEVQLKRRDFHVRMLADAIADAADGKVRITRSGERVIFKPTNTGV